MPTLDLPWTRKRAGLSKVSAPKLPDVSAASVSAVVDDARRALGAGAEEVAERAGQLGHEAGRLGRDVASSGEANLRALGSDLRALSGDLRSLRVTRRQQGADVMPGIALLAGLGSGLAAMYFFDPQQGRRRRALLRDQLVKWSRISGETVSGRAQDLRNRSMGLAHEAGSAISGLKKAADEQTDSAGSVVDTTPEAAAELEYTDDAAAPREEVYSGFGETAQEPWAAAANQGDEAGRPER